MRCCICSRVLRETEVELLIHEQPCCGECLEPADYRPTPADVAMGKALSRQLNQQLRPTPARGRD